MNKVITSGFTVRELIIWLQHCNQDAPVHVQTPLGTEMEDCQVTGLHDSEDEGVVWMLWPVEKCGSGETMTQETMDYEDEAAKPPHIQVTWQDIREGTPGDCRDCPVSRAVEREVPHFHPWGHAKVLSDTVEINGTKFRLPTIAQEFVWQFDEEGSGGSIRPIDFDLL